MYDQSGVLHKEKYIKDTFDTRWKTNQGNGFKFTRING
jgi:hypothetical protein